MTVAATIVAAALATNTAAIPAQARQDAPAQTVPNRPGLPGRPGPGRPMDGRAFQHVATFDVRANGNEVAEIVTASRDGRTLVYSDSATASVGFVDITAPTAPVAAGTVEVGGSPTSVAVTRQHVLVTVDTSNGDFVRPSGELVVLDLATRTVVKRFPLGGQPDSLALSPDERTAAIAIENQRDEESNDGLIPQAPPGQLVVVDLRGEPSWWPLRYVDFTGLSMADASDPEPEFVDINDRNLAVVSLQENNHLAVVDLTTGRIVADFPAGEVTVTDIDATEDELGPQGNGIISFTESITRRRGPDTVGWIDRDTFAVANEGDYTDAAGDEGGSRSFTLFNLNGRVEYEAGNSFEHAAARAGHYNEGRSENKGGEPEALEVGRYNGRNLLFVGAERANVLGVYDATVGEPRLLQLLPTGIGPEGLKAIPQRALLAVAAETSVDDVIPSMINLYQLTTGPATYPQLVSGDDGNGLPIGWVAQSGLAGHPTDADTLYSVSDSFLAEAGIYTIDVSRTPATITERTVVTDPDGTVRHDLDLEGVAVAPEGGFWLASEGRTNADSGRQNLLVRVDDAGRVQQEVPLPADLLAAGWTSSGFEGLAVTPSGSGTTEFVYAVVQRGWASDPAGTVKIGRYEVATGEWTFVGYRLDAPESPLGGWVGLSELTLLPDGDFAVIERDDRSGSAARIKRVYTVDLAGADFTPFGQPLPVVPKTLAADLLDTLAEHSIWTPDKLEGLAVAADGDVYVVTDNDGLDDAVGQTVFVNLGRTALD
jgi:DNA-binding beta-propeller fold protein YncE